MSKKEKEAAPRGTKRLRPPVLSVRGSEVTIPTEQTKKPAPLPGSQEGRTWDKPGPRDGRGSRRGHGVTAHRAGTDQGTSADPAPCRGREA